MSCSLSPPFDEKTASQTDESTASDDGSLVCLSNLNLDDKGDATDDDDDEEDVDIPSGIVCKPDDDECPVCLSKLPHQSNCQQYQVCCGKLICLECITSIYTTHVEDEREKIRKGKVIENKAPLCPFCREPVSTSIEESVQRLKKRIDTHPLDSHAKCLLAYCYIDDSEKLPKDVNKAIKLFFSAARDGSATACSALGDLYNPTVSSIGRKMLPPSFVEPNLHKSIHFYSLAADAGNTEAMVRLGLLTLVFGSDVCLAFRHFMSAALRGCGEALRIIKEGYIQGCISKEEYAFALRGWFQSRDESTIDGSWRARMLFSKRSDGSQSVFVTFSPPDE